MKDVFIFDILMALITVVITIILIPHKTILKFRVQRTVGNIALEETFLLSRKIKQWEEKQIPVCKLL